MQETQLNTDQLLEIVLTCTSEIGVQPPPNLRENLNGVEISSFKELQEICRQIRALLQGESEQYASMVVQQIHLKLEQTLNLDSYLNKKRELFALFLSNLPEGVSWSPSTLKKWTTAEDPKIGIRLYSWLSDNVRNDEGIDWDYVMTELLTEKQRARNPFQKEFKKTITSEEIAREFLVKFLDSLSDGISWSPEMLINWGTKDNPSIGTALHTWLKRHYRKENIVDWEMVVEKLVPEKHKEKNPFGKKRETIITSPEVAKTLLEKFLSSLPQGVPWSRISLERWSTPEDPNIGKRLYDWLIYNVRTSTGIDWKRIKNEFVPAKYRKRNPLEAAEPINIARRNLRKFIQSLPKDTTWSPVTLKRWSLENDPLVGFNLYSWLRDNIRNENGLDWDTVTTNLLSRRCQKRAKFEKKWTKIITSEEVAKDILTEFLDTLPEGSSWSPVTLERWQTAENPRIGDNMRMWLTRNVRYQDGIDWIYVLVKMLPEEYLARNPFHHRCGKGLSVRGNAGTTAKRGKDVSETNLGRGVIDKTAENPEEALLAEEESMIDAIKLLELRRALALLDESETKIINSFLKEEDVDTEALSPILTKLRTILTEKESPAIAA